jgi:hypothetical protein
MTHDRNGELLKVGDEVAIYAVIKALFDTDDYPNALLETVEGRRPDGKKQEIAAINTGVMILVERL